ncbi:guanylate kinase [Aureicoccus marinus]|uniref:Guanylate kinase n=1 Tax=Aureicoccus marinus TaxID=754435 RepID=A0A2S7T826_9FLAO|nr:guanylate kinase [Aureicoccus marinus]PQJ16080.1 guanylate kinase [Aureicoccus marinus]
MSKTTGKLLIFSAPSGSGKTTIVQHLLRQSELNLAFSVSATTREKREGETDGVNYYYLSPDTFKEKIQTKEFLEWEEVYPLHFYGTLRSEVERLWEEGKHVIFDIDVAGGLRLKEHFPERTLSVFVQPPSMDTLRERLEGRSTESAEKIEMRLAKAAQELETAPQFDYLLLNEDLEVALKEAYLVVEQFLNS